MAEEMLEAIVGGASKSLWRTAVDLVPNEAVT